MIHYNVRAVKDYIDGTVYIEWLQFLRETQKADLSFFIGYKSSFYYLENLYSMSTLTWNKKIFLLYEKENNRKVYPICTKILHSKSNKLTLKQTSPSLLAKYIFLMHFHAFKLLHNARIMLAHRTMSIS